MPRPNSAVTAAACRSGRAALVTAVLLALLLPATARAQRTERETEPDLSVVPEAEALRPEPALTWREASIIIMTSAPIFRGGSIPELTAYIQRQIYWPTEALDIPSGRLFASFLVDSTGQVRDVKVVIGLHPLIDAEAVRVIHALPRFTPAKQGDKLLSVRMTIPIVFKIR